MPNHDSNRSGHAIELTILMPCLNEAETLERCIQKALSFLERYRVHGEVLIADNGSTDGSQSLAVRCGARVVDIQAKGYGNALMGGINAAHGKYVIMADSDDSYDFSQLDAFVDALRQGWQLVMGNRFKGGVKPGAMPPLHRYLGNPVLTGIGKTFFQTPSGDFHCGLRGFDRAAIIALDLQATGMEFASEMVVKASTNKLRTTEVPTILWPDGRSRPPHLRSWRDGWRHLRFLLLFSPRWLFLYPGALLFLLGGISMALLAPQTRYVGSLAFDIHTYFYSGLAVQVGAQSVFFWVFCKIYGMREGIVPPDSLFQRISKLASLEFGLIAGALLGATGLCLGIYAFMLWRETGFGVLASSSTMRLVITSGTLLMLSLQIIHGSFFMNVLRIQSSRRQPHPPSP